MKIAYEKSCEPMVEKHVQPLVEEHIHPLVEEQFQPQGGTVVRTKRIVVSPARMGGATRRMGWRDEGDGDNFQSYLPPTHSSKSELETCSAGDVDVFAENASYPLHQFQNWFTILYGQIQNSYTLGRT